MSAPALQIFGVATDQRFGAGDDLVAAFLNALPENVGLRDGDIVVVTSKVVAKCEGAVVAGVDREKIIDDLHTRVIATKKHDRGTTRIVQTHHGLIMAAAGVDASNVEDGTLVLLPHDPDESARNIRRDLFRARGVNVGVIITDSLGRAWRLGVTDHAIGAAGLRVLDDLTGSPDAFGRTLEMTMVAVADQLAGASELARPKNSLTPFAVIRGADRFVPERESDTPQQSARDLVRSPSEDLFSLGTAEAIAVGRDLAITGRRTIRHFTPDPVPDQVLDNAIAAASRAPAPHHTKPLRFIVFNGGPESDSREIYAARIALLDAMKKTWEEDLRAEGRTEGEINNRTARGNLLRTAPAVAFAFVDLAAGAHTYPEAGGRNNFERDMFLVAGGAGVENFLIAISNQGYGSAWISSSLFCPDTVRAHLDLADSMHPLGAIAVGQNSGSPIGGEAQA